jgi:hypothetical protein
VRRKALQGLTGNKEVLTGNRKSFYVSDRLKKAFVYFTQDGFAVLLSSASGRSVGTEA